MRKQVIIVDDEPLGIERIRLFDIGYVSALSGGTLYRPISDAEWMRLESLRESSWNNEYAASFIPIRLSCWIGW